MFRGGIRQTIYNPRRKTFEPGSEFEKVLTRCFDKGLMPSIFVKSPAKMRCLLNTVQAILRDFAKGRVIRDGVITHGQRGTNRPPPGGGGYELWVKGPNFGIMAKVSYGSWI